MNSLILVYFKIHYLIQFLKQVFDLWHLRILKHQSFLPVVAFFCVLPCAHDQAQATRQGNKHHGP